MAPRRQLVLLLSAIALVASSFALAPKLVQAEPGIYEIDTLDDLPFDPLTPIGTYCQVAVPADCSLRQAVGEANRDGIPSTISLQGGLEGVININPALEGIVISANDLTLDVRPVAPETEIKLRLEGNGADFPGLKITSSNVRISGISITGFSGQFFDKGAGIHFDGPGATNNEVSGSYLGVLPNGTAVSGNLFGVLITNGASNNTISGSLIGGNITSGIWIENSSNNKIVSSSIGVGVGGVDIGNEQAGIIVFSSGSGTSTGNEIGGATSGLANTISGNGPAGVTVRAGVILRGPGTTGNRILGNRIGLNIPGANPPAVPNSGDGILIEDGAKNNTIGGAAQPLIISGNSNYGIRITGIGTEGNTIGSQVFVGTGALLNSAVGNANGGILIEAGATGTTIDGSTIAGNSGGPGVSVDGGSVADTTIRNAAIGRFTSGGSQYTFPNAVGVQILNAGTTSVISSTIAGNTQAGVLLRGAKDSSLLGNTVLDNSGGGVLLETVGSAETSATSVLSNTISGNGQYGLRLSGALTTTLEGNVVGLDAARRNPLGNTGNGIEIFDSQNTLASDTYVAGNTGAGIVVSGTSTISTSIRNAYIGLALSASGVLSETAANGLEGLRITGGPQRTEVVGGLFGGNSAAANGPAGVLIQATSGVTVTGVTIGGARAENSPNSPPTLARPFGPGISVSGPLTDVQLIGNVLRFNRGPGILVSGDADRVLMRDNRLAQNGEGIRLDGTSRFAPPRVTDPGSATNPNHDIDPPPVDVTTFSDPLRLRVDDQGLLSGFVITSTAQTESALTPVSACALTCTVQIFRPDEGLADDQGWEAVATRLAGSTSGPSVTSFTVAPGSDGSFSRRVLGGVLNTSQLLLVATDAFGNSSEYAVFPVSRGFTFESLTPPQSAGPSETVTYTLRLSNTGTLDLTNLRLEIEGALANCCVVTDPPTLPTTLEAGATRLITVSLTLPPGPNPLVDAGTVHTTTLRVVGFSGISESLQLQTTVLPRPALVATPTESLGSAKPGETVPHAFVIRNNGNVTVTIGTEFATFDAVGLDAQNERWRTTVAPDTFTLAPGEETRVVAEVAVPPGAQVEDGNGNPVQAVTIVTATVPLSPTGGFGPVSLPVTATTRVDLDPDAAIFNGDQVEPGAAGEQVIFTHIVENLSNARTRFCFVWSTNLGSTVSFRSATDGFTIDSNGCFTLDTVNAPNEGRFVDPQFDAVVTVNPRLLPGDTEVVQIWLRNEDTGTVIGSARVVNRINVLLGQKQPRVYMPLVAL